MASMLHEGLLLLFRNRPTLAPELLRDALGVSLPHYSEVRVESAELTEVVPTEYQVGPAIAQTVLAAVGGLDAERLRLYVDLTLSSLKEAARNSLEALMKSGNYEYQSEFARKYVAQGLEEGLQKGRQEGELTALFEVLNARGLEVDAEARQQIMACTDLEQLKIWVRKAVTVESVQELFERGPSPKPAARKVVKPGKSMKAPKKR